ICAAFIGLILPAGVEGATIRFATEKEALQGMMPEADRFDVEKVTLSPAQLSQAQQLAGKGFRKKRYRFWIGRKGDAPVGYAVILNVIGKKRPITFLIGIDPGGRVKGVEVLIYRESEGSEIRFPQFMRQFLKKDKESTLRLGRDIRPISGATLSSRSATYAVRKALSLFEAVYNEGKDGQAE
ncbi:MAG: FMN-binding protein, partial [Nitrospiria bacterium]